MSTVGYGDGISMPNLFKHKTDFSVMLAILILSQFGFSYCQATLRSYIESSDELPCLTEIENELKENLETFFMQINKTKGVKLMQIYELE